MKYFDLLVIGTGPAGSRVAIKCAQAGWKVAIAESREFGGTCALRGCNPKKVFVHAAEVVDAATRSNGKLCEVSDIRIDWKKLLDFKNSFVEDIPTNSRQRYEENGIETYLGSPTFVSRTQLKIGDETIEAKNIVIATGAKPRSLDFVGAEHLVTSDAFMNLESLPERIVFVGGGYISFEFAHVAARAGAEIVIIQRGERPLTGFDADAVAQLVKKSEQLGMAIHTSSNVTSVEEIESGSYRVSIESNGQLQTIDCGMVVHGAGRVPNISELDLSAGQVDFEPNAGIVVDDCLRSKTNSAVMAAGDCAATGAVSLTPTANAESVAVVKTLLSGNDTQPAYGPVPAAAFTIPAIASVGLTEEQAKEKNLNVRVNQKDISGWGSVRKVCESVAWYKTLVEEPSGKIVGAHLIGPGAAEVINLFAIAMKCDLTADEIQALSLTFPTFGYNLRQMVG
jgi:glutathione reductase (NADPH)